MKVLVLVIVSFDKPVYYDMLAVWKKRINDLTNTDGCITDGCMTDGCMTDGCTTDVWFIQCKSDKEWVGDIVNDLREPSSTPLNEHSQKSHSQKSHSLKDQFELDILNKTLYVRGDECLIPGILHKTVEALSFFLGTEASQKGGVIGRKHTTDAEQRSSPNFVWRTNLSSVLDFAGLERYLGTILSSKTLYAGYVGKILVNDHNVYIEGGGLGRKHPIRSVASGDAQEDAEQRSSPTFFASGAGFLMSRDVALYLIENKEFLRWDLIDDVAIGALLEPKFGIVPLDRCWVQSGDEDISALVANGVFHFRCESYQHLRTVEFMQYVDKLLR